MRKSILIATVLLLLATGCGSSADFKQGEKIGAYQEVVIPWPPGSPIGNLYCIRLDDGTGNADDSGLSCDWERWHKETRQ